MVAKFSRPRDSLLSSTTSRISEYARYSAIINIASRNDPGIAGLARQRREQPLGREYRTRRPISSRPRWCRSWCLAVMTLKFTRAAHVRVGGRP